MKVRTCVDEQEKLKKAVPRDASPPTAPTESVLIRAKKYSHKGRDVEICNILGDFRSANMGKDVKMAMCGMLAELMVNIYPRIYRQNMIHENGRPVLYVTLKKVLYGFLRLAFLFYERLVADMRGKGFEINPYSPCGANKMIGDNKLLV